MTTEWLLERKDLKKNNNWKGNSHENNHWMVIHMITLCIKYLFKSPSPPLIVEKILPCFFCRLLFAVMRAYIRQGNEKWIVFLCFTYITLSSALFPLISFFPFILLLFGNSSLFYKFVQSPTPPLP